MVLFMIEYLPAGQRGAHFTIIWPATRELVNPAMNVQTPVYYW